MALPITVPYTFGNATTAIPLSNLDSDYATVYQAVNGIGNGSVALANVTITGGTVSNVSGVVPTPFTANGVVYASSTSALATGGGLVFDGSNLGIGVTPSSWGSIFKVVQGGGFGGCIAFQTSGPSTKVGNNWYYDGTNYVYTTTNASSRYDLGSGQHLWYTAPSGTAGTAITFTQAMTLNATGNLFVGTTTGNFGSRITSWSNTSYTVESIRTGTGSEGHVAFVNANGAVGSIFTNASVTLYNTTSDQRLKENIQDSDSASSLIDSLQVRKFDWKANGSHQRYGFVAQELLTVAPEAVSQPEDSEQMMAVDYSKLVPMLVKEIQSLRKRILTLENK